MTTDAKFIRVIGSGRQWAVSVCQYVLGGSELYVWETCQMYTSKRDAETGANLWAERRQLPIN